MRVLLTGMSGTGKSALVQELRRRGYAAYDADDGFSEPRADGRWGWRADLVAELLGAAGDRLLFFAGCSEEQIDLPFDYRVLLTAPASILVHRLRTRASNSYGRGGDELSQILADLAEVEPRLRHSADLVLTTTVPEPQLADLLLGRIAEVRGVGPATIRTMERPREQNLAGGEAVAREVNEGIERGHWPGEEGRLAAYKCECARIDCNRLVELTPAEYETVRSHPRRFLVAPGHEDPQVETVMEGTARYLVVEKHGPPGAVAEDTNPRG